MADPLPLPSRGIPWRDFRDRLSIQLRVVHALMLREMMTRFGRSHLGFFWLMGEPLLLMAGVVFVWTLIRGATQHDVSVLALVLTGYSMLTLWRHVIMRAVHCLRQNAGLLYHRHVRPFDTLLARVVLETGGTALSFMIAYVPLALFGMLGVIADPLLMVGAWVLMAWLSFAVALLLAVLTETSDVAERLVQPVMYILLPFTGAFYMVEWLPPGLRQWVVYSPLVHANEMFRAGLLGAGVTTHFSVGYMVLCATVATALGLAAVRNRLNGARPQ